MDSIEWVTSSYILLELNLRKITRIGDYFREFILPELQPIESSSSLLLLSPIQQRYKSLWSEILSILSAQSILLRDCELVYSRLAFSQSHSQSFTAVVTPFENMIRDLNSETKNMDDLLSRLISIQASSIQKGIYQDPRCSPIQNLHRKILRIVMSHSNRTQDLLNLPELFFKDKVHLENILQSQIRSQLSTAFWILAQNNNNNNNNDYHPESLNVHPEIQSQSQSQSQPLKSSSSSTKIIRYDPHQNVEYLQWSIDSKKEQVAYITKTITSAIVHLEYFIQVAISKGVTKRNSPLNVIVRDIQPEVDYLDTLIDQLDDLRMKIAKIIFPPPPPQSIII
jgi:hypothetical protein